MHRTHCLFTLHLQLLGRDHTRLCLNAEILCVLMPRFNALGEIPPPSLFGEFPSTAPAANLLVGRGRAGHKVTFSAPGYIPQIICSSRRQEGQQEPSPELRLDGLMLGTRLRPPLAFAGIRYYQFPSSLPNCSLPSGPKLRECQGVGQHGRYRRVLTMPCY